MGEGGRYGATKGGWFGGEKGKGMGGERRERVCMSALHM